MTDPDPNPIYTELARELATGATGGAGGEEGGGAKGDQADSRRAPPES